MTIVSVCRNSKKQKGEVVKLTQADAISNGLSTQATPNQNCL